MKEYADRERGNIMLFCLAIMLIMVSVCSLLTVIVVSRSTYVRKSADYNDNVLLLEDANIRYLGEFSKIQAETSKLVVYYFSNGFYNKKSQAYVGYLANYDKYLKNSIASSVQGRMFDYFKEREDDVTEEDADPVTGETIKTVDYESLEGEVAVMANYLYAYLLTKRFQYPSGDDLSMIRKLKKINGEPSDLQSDGTVNGNIAAKYGTQTYGRVSCYMPADRSPESRLDLQLLNAGTAAAPGISYWESKYTSVNPAPPGMSSYLLEGIIYSDLEINPDEMYIEGVSHLKQTVKVKMPVPDVTALWQAGEEYYMVNFIFPNQLEPEEWRIESVN